MAADTGQRYMGLSLTAGAWGQIHGTIPHSGGDSGTVVVAGS